MNAERRNHPRRAVTRPYVSHLLLPSGSARVAVLSDVSRGGFRGDVIGHYRPGDRLTMEPQRPHPLAGRRFPVVVAWSRQASGSQIGARFAAEITEAESEALATG